MNNHEMNLKMYAEEPLRLARDQARLTTVARGHATGEVEEREISVYALRTLSDAQLRAIWPHLPKPAPKPSYEDQMRAVRAMPSPPRRGEEISAASIVGLVTILAGIELLVIVLLTYCLSTQCAA